MFSLTVKDKGTLEVLDLYFPQQCGCVLNIYICYYRTDIVIAYCRPNVTLPVWSVTS